MGADGVVEEMAKDLYSAATYLQHSIGVMG